MLYAVLCVLYDSIAALSGLVIGRLRYCVKASRGLPNRKHLGLIAERLSAIILRRISEIVCTYVCMYVSLVYLGRLVAGRGKAAWYPLHAHARKF